MARDAEFRARIVADDDASKVIDKVAAKADELESTDAEITVTANTRSVSRDIDQVLAKVDRLAGSDAANLVLTSNATQITNDIADLVADLDRLDANDPQVDVNVASIRELEDGLERISAKAKEINGTPIQLDTGGAKTGVDDLGRSADSSKSVLANMVGNATQDLGALGGVAGSAGVAIGQMGEYMVDAANSGDKVSAVLGNFTKVAAPIGLIALAVNAVTEVMGRFAASAERTKDSVQRWTDAMRSGGDASAEYADAMRDLGAVTLDVTRTQSGLQNVVAEMNDSWYQAGLGSQLFGKIIGATNDETKDMTDELVRAGVGIDQWTRAVEGGETGAAALQAVLAASGLSAQEQADVMATLAQAQTDHAAAAKADATFTSFFGDAADGAAMSAEELAAAEREAAEAAVEHAIKVADTERALIDMASAFDAMGSRGDALSALFDLGNAPEDAAGRVRDLQIAIDGLDDALADVDVGAVLSGDVSADSFLDAIDGIRPQIQAAITDAFAAGGPEAGTAMANSYIDQVTAELGGKLTREQVAQLLGLENIEAVVGVAVEMSDIDKARRQLALLTGITGETEYSATIALALDAGTITGAQAQTLVQAQLGNAGVEIPAALAVPTTSAALAEANAALAGTPATMPTRADPSGAAADVEGFADSEHPEATVDVLADPGQAERDVDDFTSERRSTDPVKVDANTAAAITTMLLLKVLATALQPVVTVTANTFPAALAMLAVSQPRTATINASVPNAGAVDRQLDNIARNRNAVINVTTVNTSVLRRVDGGG